MKTKNLHLISLAMSLLLAVEASSKQALEEDQPSLPPGEEAAASTGEEDGTPYQHFIALNHSQTCIGDEHATPFNNQIRGVNLGGWMVLEPWITPTMFYQFLDGNETSTAFDTYTFCQVLGGAEANRQLRNHWDTWVTEEIIQELAASGAVNSLRLPVGDFMYEPYGPYLDGCWDGALEKVDQLLDWANEYGLSVLIDVHTMKDSQNGFDNSGQAMGLRWTSNLNNEFSSLVTFEHWPIRSANWMGEFDGETASYPKINHDNIDHALRVLQKIVNRYKDHRAVLGLEPVNEPWNYTPLKELKRFYWEGYLIVKQSAPYWKYIIHDAFQLDPSIWGGFMKGCPDRALDTHIYQAWRDPDSRVGFYNDACAMKGAIANMEKAFGPVVVGEWSLATDNCAMWLNGFNDNLPGFPRLPCKYVPCSDHYMGKGKQPGTPVDKSKGLQGPFGTGMSGPVYGYCPVDRDWLVESSGNPQTGHDWVRAPPDAPPHLDDTDNVMKHLALKKINAFSGIGHGFYFWNFRTDLPEPRWSYMLALEKGWIPSGNLNDEAIMNACEREDKFDFKCVLKSRNDVRPQTVKNAVQYMLKTQNLTKTTEGQAILAQDEDGLYKTCSDMIPEYFEKFRADGVTCDFGGIALLVYSDREITDDDKLLYNDDEYYVETVYTGPTTVVLVSIVAVAAILGTCLGFMIAMRTNKGFNRRVQSSTLFRPLTGSRSNLVRRSFALDLDGYEDISDIGYLVEEHQQQTKLN